MAKSTESGASEKSKTAIKIGSPENPVRISYAHIWEPKENVSGKKKYSVSIIIPKKFKKTLAKVRAAIDLAKNSDAAITKFGGKVPKNLKVPLRDSETDREDDPAYEDSFFLNATSDSAPGIAKLVKGKLRKVEDRQEVYSGCFCVISVNFYPFKVEGSRGIACGLNNILKIEDGEPLAGRADVAADFKEYGEFESDEEEYEEEDEDEEGDDF